MLNEQEKKLLEQEVKLVPVSPYIEQGAVEGLMLPGGTLLMNMSKNTSGATLALYAKTAGAKIITVKGTWTFEPDLNTIKEFEVHI